MCGIAGFIYNPNENAVSWCHEKTLQEMLHCIAHRGPDDMGYEVGSGYGLGQVRLSIIDTSKAGHQPMWCAEKRYALVYNGEIYNYQDLRAELQKKGCIFYGQSDTEVLLYALKIWGIESFKRIEGMFAGVLVDTKTGQSLLFRDHLGIKPLYYTYHDNVLLFASEIRAIKPIVKTFKLDHSSLFEHLNFRYVAGERTLYSGIKRLLPGHCITITAQSDPKLHKYYDVTDSLNSFSSSLLAQDEIEHALRTSIKAHTVSDVGFSVQLSGGVDSSYITTVLSEISYGNIDTYSVSLPNDPHDEGIYQRTVISKCGTLHNDFPCDGKKFADLFPEVIEALDSPIVHTGTVFLYWLCQNIARTHKVVLTGEGADELFLGYNRYNIPLSHKISFYFKRMGIPEKLIPNLPKFRAIRNLMQHSLGMESGVFHSDIANCFALPESAVLFRNDTIKPFDKLIDQMIATDQKAYLGSLLERQDKISMAHGLEARVPFCNYKLFDQINPIAHSRKITPVPKAILKSILAKTYDRNFVYRPKNGFKLPIDEWIRNKKMMGRYLDYITDTSFKNRGIYNTKVVSEMVDAHLKSKRNHANDIFTLMSLEIWARQKNV